MHIIIIKPTRANGYLLIVNGVTELTNCTFTQAEDFARLLIKREMNDA